MRRLLPNPPKNFRHELLGELSRATLNECSDFEPFTFEPRRPYHCPVCGEESDLEGRVSTVLTLEFANAPTYNFVTWAHGDCLLVCVETGEPDATLE